jgi:dTMP kinase
LIDQNKDIIIKSVPCPPHMSHRPKQGLFVTFEGGDGTGKTTQITATYNRLVDLNVPCAQTREPGGTPVAESIRSIFLQNDLHPTEDLLLLLAARHHHVRTHIMPLINQRHVVLCDRFIDSNLVYQGTHIDPEEIIAWHKMAHIHCWPDITFLLQDPNHALLKQRNSTPLSSDRFDHKSTEFHDRIHHAYCALATQYKDRYIVVPHTLSLNQATDFIVRTIIDKWHTIHAAT